MKYLACIFLITLLQTSCKESTENPAPIFDLADLNQANRKLLEIAMEDGFSPPVASRVYVYPHIAYYITLRSFYPDSLPELISKLNELKDVIIPEKTNSNPELAALLSFCKTAKKLVFSEHYVESYIEKILKTAELRGMSEAGIRSSIEYAEDLSNQIAKWFSKDHYIETRTMDRYTSTKKRGEWIETPPDYTIGLEAHWMKIRPLVIDSINIFKPASGPPPYNTSKNSEFYKMVMEVYEESKKLDSAKIEIAWYWDDNPNISQHVGHLVTMTHKISPPGHWLNIIHQVSERENCSLFKATQAYTFAAIAMFDAIISCWYEKYKTNLVRPITYIQENIDHNWRTLIQTPPFPEYTSGHSATSAAAATVLTNIFGDNYAFTDSTEVLFQLPARSFKSFNQAAWEVSLSRFYGGIHYMISVVDGNKQGNFIANKILEQIL
jgi:hypothetical protein